LIDKKIDSRSEKGKRFILKNGSNRKVRYVQVDGCLLTDEQKKCDFLYEIASSDSGSIETVFFVELKGTDFSHGIEQLENTVKVLKEWYRKIANKRAFLVGRGIPSFETKTQKVALRFKRCYDVSFHAKTNLWEEVV
jgi:hypothetical protein